MLGVYLLGKKKTPATDVQGNSYTESFSDILTVTAV